MGGGPAEYGCRGHKPNYLTIYRLPGVCVQVKSRAAQVEEDMPRKHESLDRKINRANVNGSLKVTVPPAVVKELGLAPGDLVRFAVISEDGKKVAKFKKLRVVVTED